MKQHDVLSQHEDRLARVEPEVAQDVERLLALAPRGLARGYDAGAGGFAQTLRLVAGRDGVALRAEGQNLRYTAMALLGLGRLGPARAREVLGGTSPGEVLARAARTALDHPDPGAVALVAWAEAELSGVFDDKLFCRLEEHLAAGQPLPTVDVSWMLTAATVAAGLGRTDLVTERAAARLTAGRGPQGIYPHVLPSAGKPRWRAHVGSFADQVYPLQALARASVHGPGEWLAAADLTAARLCDLQGEQGQWWWHYDARDGTVVERYPVYSVHQHAMAPMVLLDLLEAGGADHRDAVARGVGWLGRHPEALEELVSERWGVVWRKVGRREPRKAARALQAAASAAAPGVRVPGLDVVLPPGVVDHECRPYELGWLLYAWLPTGAGDE
ncbi:hypothetical protein [Nocardioides solisilvae]|uniref:hypothetical protein n=1 Tax=Nocardioides solisilvae TaxID=1542435 RepID=UPI000D746923|nr:hypothetical protein [Nocardioides solisilvae]